MKILTIANQKGGVGKSADTCQLSYYLASLGYRVFVSDLDHQMHTSKPIVKAFKNAPPLSISIFHEIFSSMDIIEGNKKEIQGFGKKPKFAKCETGVLCLAPGSQRLNLLEREKLKHNDYVNNLKSFMDYLDGHFDICIIDTNPNPDIRVIAALTVATHVITPIQLNQESIDGLSDFLNHPNYGLNNIKQKLNKKLKFVGALPSMVQGSKYQKDNFEEVKKHLKHFLIPLNDDSGEFAYVPFSVSIAEAQQQGVPLFELKKSSARKAWQTTKRAFDAIIDSIGLEKK